jgi:hypothetical protein
MIEAKVKNILSYTKEGEGGKENVGCFFENFHRSDLG